MTPRRPIRLPLLHAGARVAVVAPSSPIRREMLDAGLAELGRLGLDARAADGVEARHLFFAGDDDLRLRDLQSALDSADCDAIVLARGGYGLTPLLRSLRAPRNPKLVLGESDATALGCWALTHGVGWLHGPMVAGCLRLGAEGYDQASLRQALFEAAGEASPAGTRALATGEAEGVLWGGCLTLLAALCGTPWTPHLGPSILALEDTGVKPYQVHRMIVQLRDAGALEGVRGVLLGDFSDCVQHAEQGYDVADVLRDLLASILGPVPVSIGWPIGHAPAPHLTLPMGARAMLRVPEGGAPSLRWRRDDLEIP